MHEVIHLQVKPKMEAFNHEGHRYILKFEPNATPDERWSWAVEYTVKYHYFGAAETSDLAARRAKSQINKLLRRETLNE